MENEELEKIKQILVNKLGLPNNYEIEDYMGDHKVWNSKDFNKNEIRNLENLDITPEIFEEIYNKYIDNIIEVIKRNPYMKVYAIMDKGEQSEFDAERIKKDNSDFKNNDIKLNSRVKITLKTFIELMDTYDIKDLLNEDEVIKKELENGVFDLIKENSDAFTTEEREKIDKINWKKEDIYNYYNLKLLKERLDNILKNGKVEQEKVYQMTKLVDYILESDVPAVDEKIEFENKSAIKSEFISKLMEDLYKDFEVINRKDLISNFYSPTQDVTSKKQEDIPDTILAHFYEPDVKFLKKIFTNVIINRERLKNGEGILPSIESDERGRIKGIEYPELKEKYKEKIEEANLDDALDELQPDKVFKITDEDINNKLGYRLEVFKGEQLACTTVTQEELITRCISRYINFAVCFGNELSPDSILLTCDRNADSNLGIENIPYKNKFEELSKTCYEMNASGEENKEALLKRENLKAGYMLCTYNGKLMEENEDFKDYALKCIEQETKKAKELGLNIVMFDLGEIIKERENKESIDVPSDDGDISI